MSDNGFCKRNLGNRKLQTYQVTTLDRPPSINCGVEMFGPFLIKEDRKVLKIYSALFTCLASRAVHIESTRSMDADSFIPALCC